MMRRAWTIACVTATALLYAFVIGRFVLGCGGRAFTAAHAGDVLELDAGDVLELDAGDVLELDAGDVLELDAGDEVGSEVTSLPPAPLGPTCMFGACDGELAGFGMGATCGAWCCNSGDACDAPQTALCAAGPCGAGNSNTTCATGGFLLCCSVDRGCP